MLDLRPRGQDIRAFVKQLEQWIIATLAEFGVESFTRDGRIGVWTNTPGGGEAKIAALGIRVQGWVTSHGIAINVKPDLSHYLGIVPCGIREFGVTSLAALGVDVGMDAVDAALKRHFPF
jgi:lipoyl(octanoyl) transferase